MCLYLVHDSTIQPSSTWSTRSLSGILSLWSESFIFVSLPIFHFYLRTLLLQLFHFLHCNKTKRILLCYEIPSISLLSALLFIYLFFLFIPFSGVSDYRHSRSFKISFFRWFLAELLTTIGASTTWSVTLAFPASFLVLPPNCLGLSSFCFHFRPS